MFNIRAWQLGLPLALLAFSSASYAIDNGTYTIQSKYSGKVVEVAAGSADDAANVAQWPSNGHPTQQWIITQISGDDYSIINANSGKAMEVYDFDTTDGGNIVQYAYWGGDPQLWTITDQGGYYSLINKHSGKALDLLNWDTTDGANIGQWAWWGGDAQLWALNAVQPSTVTFTLEENQAGFCSVDGSIDSNHAGYTGSGFANTTNANGQGVNWSVNVATAGTYTFIWRYAGTSNRPANLLIDGSTQVSGIALNSTGAWATWANSAEISVWLDTGVHSLRLQATTSAGLPNIDSLSITGQSATAGNCGGAIEPITFATPSFTNIAVHDPSVIKANNQYYVFGSHLSVAKTPDLKNWSRVADGVTTNNPLFNDVTSELAEALAWAETTTLWAPDVTYVNGRYLMYYNACRGDSPLSAMGIASSSSIEGPYTNDGIFLKSGMWGQTSEDGTVYDATVHPNVVDPVIFSDANNRMWMTYGSYSGGIFIMELNPSTGFPYAGQGYGKHLMGGNHARIEGAYTIYSPETGYYYMYVSYGGLGADGGYNVRVARATSPDGPYYDANGTNMANVKSNPSLPLFDDASIAPHGVKLMGNHVFSGTNNVLGYVSPGHNSAYRDATTGQTFLLFHTRFPGRGEEHEVRVHEVFYNDAGWPVIAPLRYAQKVDANNPNRSASELNAVYASELPGSYKLINHGKDISATIKNSVNITLNSNGSISGDRSGSWTYNANTRNTVITVADVAYRGVVSRQWNQVRNRFEVTFSALSADGTAIWGVNSD